ncbi:MAG: hypothetical protein MI866_20950 [Bacteroidales bacterium]|nr:hypothetical protein [Bacteroidales bacterium]
MFRYQIVIILFFSVSLLNAQDSRKQNDFLVPDSILDLPLTDKKLVIAHYMTNIVPAKIDDKISSSYDLTWFDPNGASKTLGGVSQTAPYTSLLKQDLSLEQAAEFEMQTALKLGVDGFHFFYPGFKNDAAMKKYNAIIKAFFKVAEQKSIDFKMTLCLCNPKHGVEKEKISRWARGVKDLMKSYGQSDNWLKTPDGRYVFYTWVADGIIDDLKGKHWEVHLQPEYIKNVAIAYNKLAAEADIEIAYNYHLRWPEKKEFVDNVLQYFPAVCGWTSVLEKEAEWKAVATKCHLENRDYTQTVYPDFYTSKVYRKTNKQLILNNAEIVKLGADKVCKHVHKMGLSEVFRGLNQWAIDTDASLINFTTWNDFPEGQHLAPEFTHNFGFSVLLHYYKQIWQCGDKPFDLEESATVFYKKYPESTEPKYNIECKVTRGDSKLNEDYIEVVTILDRPAQLIVGGNHLGIIQKGLQVTKLPMFFEAIHVKLIRDGKAFINFTSPVNITKTPHRTDRLTYSYSSEYNAYFKSIFGVDSY